ncbi:MAG: exosortase/archaeosortase family protein [Phycisphaerae bacterium]|nr:exosortase/archaeosortase family protein [Phycisphaerae bacterium]
MTDLAAAVGRPPSAPGLSRRTWAKIAILAALLALLNRWQFRPLAESWIVDPNWSHGFLIPLFSLYLLYARREELLSARRRPCLWGLPILLGGMALSVFGFHRGTWWFSQLGIPIMLFGLVLYQAGPGVMRIAWLPILYLVLAMPIPEILYVKISLPLQNFAARGATTFLQLCGVEMGVTASRLDVVSRSGAENSLTVAEACSGIRSLIAYIALGVAWAYLEYRPIWQRLVLVAAAVPIAIFLNVARVAITCTMYVIDKPELGRDFMHEVAGMVMLAPALVLFWLLSWVLRSLVIEVDEDAPPAAASGKTNAP